MVSPNRPVLRITPSKRLREERSSSAPFEAQRKCCSMSWSPAGCSPQASFLLAVGDSSGHVTVYAPCDEAHEPVELQELQRRVTDSNGVVEVCFAPTPVLIESEGRTGKDERKDERKIGKAGTVRPSGKRFSAVLCASKGPHVVIWHCLPSGTCQLVKSISLDSEVITALTVSRSFGAQPQTLKSMLVLGTKLGRLHFKQLHLSTKDHKDREVRISPISTSDLETADRCVTEVKVFCDADGDSTDLLVAIAHGVQLSCAVLRISDDGHLETSRSRREKSTRHEEEHVSWLMASTPCHGLPIVSLLCDTTGVLAASDPMLGSSFVSRANVLTLDSSGYAVIWQLEEAEAQEGSCRGLFLRPSRFCSLVAKSMQNYLTAAEQAAICMETRMVRTAARERELLQDKKLFSGFSAVDRSFRWILVLNLFEPFGPVIVVLSCSIPKSGQHMRKLHLSCIQYCMIPVFDHSGFALSPSHCMLVTQTVLPSTRTTQIRPVTFLLASSLGSPAHAFTALLRNVGDSLYRRRCRRESVSTGRAARRPSRPEGMEQTQSETCDNGDHIHHRRRKAAGGSSYPLYLSLWDVSEAWRSMVFGAGKSLGAMCRASWDEKKPCEGSELPNGLLESILQWLWELQEGLQGAFQHISDSAASSATGSAAGCKVSLLLRHTAAQQVTFTLSSPKSFTERWASEASPRRRHFLAQIRHELNELALKTWTSDTELNAAKGGQSSFAGVEEDELAMCQVCNALLELGHKATRDLRRKYLLAELPPKNPVVRAAACAYWRQRAKALPGSVVRSAVLDCLAKVEDSLKEAELESTSCGSCRLCGEPAVIDPSFMQVSCGSHVLPLCQQQLLPLLTEPHILCHFCGRCTSNGSECQVLGVCAWCATPVM